MKSRPALVVLVVALALGVTGAAPSAGRAVHFTPGAAGAGDHYYPHDGNGGYDVAHYDLDLTYRPGNERLSGVATIKAFARQNLSRFNLDLDGLEVLSILVDGRPADWSRRGGELRVTPAVGLRYGRLFTTEVSYAGVPRTLNDGSGFVHTPDGALVSGEPHVAATWFPVNDHPSDKASYTYRITVPRRLGVVANGELRDTSTVDGWRTWHWEAAEPMASYLATASIGKWKLTRHDGNGIPLLDAVDAGLYQPFAQPHGGDEFAFSDQADSSYKRLTHTLSVPADGGTLSFWVDRSTEPRWDHFFVEARSAGQGDWTTLPDVRGHTTRSTGSSCPYWLPLHPFLKHYESRDGQGGCLPRGSTGKWWAKSGSSNGYEHWTVDLTPYAGSDVEVSLAYASDDSIQEAGVAVDDIVSTTGEGSTGFEDDGDQMDGWVASGAPARSPGNTNDWTAGTPEDAGSQGDNVDMAFAREGEILDFLASFFGPYPFSTSGGIVDDYPLGFALENQTRPTYDPSFFNDPAEGTVTVVHELAHQWVGDNLAVKKWKNIWLNEGFASYTEWLWSEHEGQGTPAEIFEDVYHTFGANDPFWRLPIGDPGSGNEFAGEVYVRGALTLQALRETVGDDDFFRILRQWTTRHAGGNVAIPQFIRLSERVSGQDLGDFFDAWLYSTERPPEPAARHAIPSQAELSAFRAKLRERTLLH